MALSDLLSPGLSGAGRQQAVAMTLRGPRLAAREDILAGTVAGAPATAPPPQAPTPAPSPPPGGRPSVEPLATLAVDPRLLRPDVVLRPDIILRPPPPQAQPRLATQLARAAIDQLRGVPPPVVNDALAAVHNVSLQAENLMAFLARRVLVGEVLSAPADRWSQETRGDFAEALNLPAERLDVMNSIVSLAVLNDPDLEQEVRGENIVPPTEGDLLGSRRVVWQYPPPGTVLQPPYVVLIAVEHQEVAAAEEVVRSILNELVTHRGFRLPRAVVERL